MNLIYLGAANCNCGGLLQDIETLPLASRVLDLLIHDIILEQVIKQSLMDFIADFGCVWKKSLLQLMAIYIAQNVEWETCDKIDVTYKD